MARVLCRLASVAAVPLFCLGCAGAPIGPSVSSLTITGSTPAIGQKVQLAAKITLSSGENKDVTADATWSSSNPSVATVTAGGLLTLLQQGTCTISATYQGVTGTYSVSGQIATNRGTLTYLNDSGSRSVIAFYATTHDNTSWGDNLIIGQMLDFGQSYSMAGVGATSWDVRIDFNGSFDGHSTHEYFCGAQVAPNQTTTLTAMGPHQTGDCKMSWCSFTFVRQDSLTNAVYFGATFPLFVTASDPSCQYAVQPQVPWITVSPDRYYGGSLNSTITVTIAPNPLPVSRMGTIDFFYNERTDATGDVIILTSQQSAAPAK